MSESPETFDASNPQELRRTLLAEILPHAEADAALWYDIDTTGTIVGLEVVGDARVASQLAPFVGRRFPHGGVHDHEIPGDLRGWNVHTAPVDVRCRFRTYRQDYADADRAEDLPIYRHVYRPAGANDHLRALVYRGERYLGWFGVVRGDRYHPRDGHRWNATLPRVASGLAAARALERVGDDAFLVLRPDGRVEHGTEGALRWWTRARGATLATLVRAADTDESATGLVGGVHIRLVRLAGASARYLALLRDRDLLSLHPTSVLSASERLVAEDLA
ncbi:MAG: hypothetical protein KC586_10710, partial [Myxococcales bacterium]|nr:hypothetical protein [Myxococcales bacterium]